METINKDKMDVKRSIEEIMDKYTLEEVKAYFQSLDSEILKRELFERMSKDLDEDHLKCPFCGSQKVHKSGKTP